VAGTVTQRRDRGHFAGRAFVLADHGAVRAVIKLRREPRRQIGPARTVRRPVLIAAGQEPLKVGKRPAGSPTALIVQGQGYDVAQEHEKDVLVQVVGNGDGVTIVVTGRDRPWWRRRSMGVVGGGGRIGVVPDAMACAVWSQIMSVGSAPAGVAVYDAGCANRGRRQDRRGQKQPQAVLDSPITHGNLDTLSRCRPSHP
jgi:hypothetical protein